MSKYDFSKITTDKLIIAVDKQDEDATCYGIGCSDCPFDEGEGARHCAEQTARDLFREELARREGETKPMNKTIKTHVELVQLHGKKITCKIYNNEITDAKICVEGYLDEVEIFICQDIKDGSDAKDKLGYEYSWIISTPVTPLEINNRDVTDIRLVEEETERKDDNPMPELKAGMFVKTEDGISIVLPQTSLEPEIGLCLVDKTGYVTSQLTSTLLEIYDTHKGRGNYSEFFTRGNVPSNCEKIWTATPPKTADELAIERLEATIEDALAKIKELKEGK